VKSCLGLESEIATKASAVVVEVVAGTDDVVVVVVVAADAAAAVAEPSKRQTLKFFRLNFLHSGL